MKTIVPFKLLACMIALGLCVNAAAQNEQGLVFKNPSLVSGQSNSLNAVYLFKNVTTDVDATISIDSLVGNAEVKKIDDNSGGLGYLNAWQPEVKMPSGTGTSFAVFTIRFYVANTSTPKMMDEVRATALDIDGNLTMKEFVEIGMGGGTASYQTGTIDISILQLLFNKFKAQNILGIERSDIDTAALGNMFTVTKSYLDKFTVKVGATRLATGNANRQFSLYMKGFNYINTSTLPIKLKSFNANLKNENTVDLTWTTSAEVNVSHFVVEKSTNGTSFSDAGIVFAYGNSTVDRSYSLSDKINANQDAVFFYRLRSVDNDGKSQVSETRAIRVTTKTQSHVTILTYPNPASNELRITVPAGWQNRKVVFELYTANGQAIRRTENASSSQTETMNISTLAPGFYMVRVTCNGEVAQQKIMKQ